VPADSWARGRLAAAALLSSLLIGKAPAQRAPAEPPTAQEAPKVEIRIFSPEEDLADLLDVCAAMLGTAIEFNRAEVSGPIGLRLPSPATRESLWGLANRALATRGFTTIQLPGSPSLTVVKLSEAAGLARLEGMSLAGSKAGFVKCLVELSHERTEGVSEGAKLLLSKAGTIAAFKDSRSVLIADLRPNVEQALRVAARLDGDFAEMDVTEIPLEHATPVDLVALIERIMTTRKAVFGEKPAGTVIAHPEGRSALVIAPAIEMDVWRDLVERFDRVEPTRTQNYFPRRFGVRETASLVEQMVPAGSDKQGWRIVTDELTGALVVTATAAQHQAIQELFDRLESTAQGPRRPIRSFPIRNRGVEELRDLLQAMLDKGALEGLPDVQTVPTGEVIDRVPVEASAPTPATPPQQVQGPTGPIPALYKPKSLATKGLGDEVILTADKATNRLVAMGNARVLEQLGALIEELDVRHPQVLVEALVVTLTDDQTRSLGVELQKIGVDGDVRLASLFGLGSPDPGSIATLPPPGGIGASGVVLDPGSYSAAIRALETINQGRSLTIPKVLVNNNQKASLNSVLQTPFASTNASTTVATTSFGGTLDAGTQISVTPQITEGDQLLLEYSISLSSFVGAASDPALPPPRQENKLQSTVAIPDGYTVVVGGLEIESDSKVSTQVPWLGRIPVLGALFATQSRIESKAHFFVFLRTTVMRSPTFEDLRFATEHELAVAGVDDGWPKLEPRWIR
jgi:type II secretory pathway component GspD/PulD (secretin)